MKPNQPKKRRFWTFGRLTRAFAWLVIVLALYAGLGIGGWFFLKANAGKLTEMASQDVDIGFGELITKGKDKIEITDVRYGEIAKIEKVTVLLDYSESKVPKIRSIEIVRPEVVVTDELIAGSDEEKSEPLDLSWLQLGKATIKEGRVKVALSGFPETTAEFDVSAEGVDGASGGALSAEPITVKLKNVESAGYGTVDEAEVLVRVPGDLKSVELDRFFVRGVKLDARDVAGFTVAGTVDVEGGKVHVSEAGIRSGDLMKVAIRDASADDFVSTERIDIELVPDAFLEDGQIDRLYVKKPSILVNGDLMKRLGLDESEVEAAVDVPLDVVAGPTMVYKVRDLKIDEGSVVSDLGGWMPGIPYVKSALSLRTEGEGEDSQYVLDLNGLEFRTEMAAETRIARGTRLTAAFTAEGLQKEQRIKSVEMSGFDATIDEAIEKLVAKMDEAKATDSDDESVVVEGSDEGSSEWIVDSFAINDSRVTIQDLVPGLPVLPFQLDDIELKNVPLSGRDRGDEHLQRVELADLDIASALNPLINVAKLRSIWVEFTVPGIFRSEIEKIEILGPEVFVGEHLFWYIDYYREYDTETGTKREDIPEPVVVEVPKEAEKKAGDEGSIEALDEVFAAMKLSGWTIKKIAAHNGKIIVAPQGTPLGRFPFPFSFESDLEKKKIDLSLEVEQGDYTYEAIKVELKQLKGKSYFNYPIRTKDNNFVQTFDAEVMRYEQLEAQNVTLTVTYDRNGIYGKIYGKAYGGDMNAEFNIYIGGDDYKWDAWVSAVGFELGPFTEVLVPDNLKMSGRIDGKIVTNGVEYNVEKAVGDIQAGAGTMHVTKLDEVIATFPEDWSEIQKMLVQTGLDIFRNYSFEKGSANLELTGRDGTASVLFEGKDGKRDLQFRFMDERDEKLAAAKTTKTD